jgi:hypothetical protein
MAETMAELLLYGTLVRFLAMRTMRRGWPGTASP